ncbi:MAG: hypothetical protein AAF560_17260 [Acidobacteriota bacterium]
MGFFDYCDHLAFVAAPRRWELANFAVELAARNGDPHLENRSKGVLSHAHINCANFFSAGKTLEEARDKAMACCPDCRSEHLRREGDLLGEQRQARSSLERLDGALAEGVGLDADGKARIYFLRAIAHHHAANRAGALADAGRTLEHLALDSPRGFFLGNAALLAVYLRGGSRQQDQLVAEQLESFNQRIKGLRGWKDYHTYSNWARGHVDVRLGNIRSAHRRFKRAWMQLLDWGLPREAVACTLDRCILLCRGDESRSDEPRGDAPLIALGFIERCERERSDLLPEHREGFRAMKDVLRRYPEGAFRELVGFRQSFIAPVPCAMVERLTPKMAWVKLKRRKRRVHYLDS